MFVVCSRTILLVLTLGVLPINTVLTSNTNPSESTSEDSKDEASELLKAIRLTDRSDIAIFEFSFSQNLQANNSQPYFPIFLLQRLHDEELHDLVIEFAYGHVPIGF